MNPSPKQNIVAKPLSIRYSFPTGAVGKDFRQWGQYFLFTSFTACSPNFSGGNNIVLPPQPHFSGGKLPPLPYGGAAHGYRGKYIVLPLLEFAQVPVPEFFAPGSGLNYAGQHVFRRLPLLPSIDGNGDGNFKLCGTAYLQASTSAVI